MIAEYVVELRISPLSSFTIPVKTKVKTSQASHHSSFHPIHKPKQHTQVITAPKKGLTTNNILILSKKGMNKPTLSIRTVSNNIQPPALADKKGVLLYQQIERNKLFSNGNELINRFNLKV